MLPIASWRAVTDDQDRTTGRTRWVIGLLTVGVLLDLMISVILVYQNRQIEHAASSAHISRLAAYQSCLNGNTFRANDQARWDAIIKLLRSGDASPALTRFIVGVQAANGRADHPVDCVPLRP
jgi:hypothetical protein